jgi:hypothetical protein
MLNLWYLDKKKEKTIRNINIIDNNDSGVNDQKYFFINI